MLGPPDIESRIGLTGGNIFQGEVTPDQMWEGRFAPAPRFPASTCAGRPLIRRGASSRLNGRNAAEAVLADAGVALGGRLAAPASEARPRLDPWRRRALRGRKGPTPGSGSSTPPRELIASDGIDEVRIARVANRAGASTALVHHYFSTREELLAQALLQSFELAADERFVAGPAAAASATEGLAIAIEECLPTPGEGEREWVLWVELWLRAAREPELRPVAGRMYESYREWVARVIRRGVESGEFRRGRPGRGRRPGDGAVRRARASAP